MQGSESPVRVDYVDQDDDDGVLVKLDDVKAADDVGKEDMFVDAPEELAAYDGRNVHSGISVQEYSDDEHNTQDHQLPELGILGSVVEKTANETGSARPNYEVKYLPNFVCFNVLVQDWCLLLLLCRKKDRCWRKKLLVFTTSSRL